MPQARRLRLVVLVHMPLGRRTTSAHRERRGARGRRGRRHHQRWTRRRLLERYALPADRVHVAEPGVDAAELAPGTATGGALLCVAAVTPARATTCWSRRWRRSPTCPGAACASAASTATRRSSSGSAAASDGGLGDRVRFTGPRTGAELDRSYAAADLLVLASRGETYGMVVTEALARGLPVVATDVGGVPEALGTAPTAPPGLLVPPGRPGGAGRGAARAGSATPTLRERLRRAAARAARDAARLVGHRRPSVAGGRSARAAR